MEVAVELAEEDLRTLRKELVVGDDVQLNEREKTRLRLLLDTGTGPLDAIQTLALALRRSDHRLHEVVERARLILPSPPPPPPRNPELEARVHRLRIAQENREYKRMTRDVDSGQRFGQVPLMADFGSELQSVNRQAMAVFNTLVTVAGAFVFGFFGVDLAYPAGHLDLGVKMMIGLVLATIVFFADLYFLVRNMDMDKIPDECDKKTR